jgi:hypothetical protein
MVFPPHRIVERVRSSVSPKPVKSVLFQRRLGSGQFEKLVSGQYRDFGRQDFCFGDRHSGESDFFVVRRFSAGVQNTSGSFQHRLGGV